MSPTRQPSFQVFSEFPEAPMQTQPQMRSKPQLAPSAMPLQPMRPNSQHAYHPLQPNMQMKQHHSPVKSSYPPMPGEFSHMNMAPAMTLPESIPGYSDSPQKRMIPSSHPLLPAPPMHHQPMFSSWDSNFQHFEQENFPVQMPMPNNFVDFPHPDDVRRGALKRSYSETVASSDRPQFRRGKTGQQDDGEESTELPPPEEMPIVIDDGQKPPFSYAQMIGMAILRSPGRRLTLAQIYEWISTTFQFYREDPKTGWHNSIRHNLSLNKAFNKQERPKSDAGKGCYWVIQPGMEAQFFKDKPRKNNNNPNVPMLQSFSSQPTMQAMAQPIAEAIQPRNWVIQSQITMESVGQIPPHRPQTAPSLDAALPELSSDATLPASDPALAEEEVVLSKEIPDLQPPSMQPPPSSPPVINSSPPVVPRNHQRTISSPANIARPTAKRRKTTTGMDDSGYFSSLESSARRPRHGGVMPTSELGFLPPSRKRLGRAEAEIVRIRSSSHDITPSGRRFRSADSEQRSSSPLRQSPTNAPTTPPEVFKKPYLPPHSVSPNTQLKRHRDAMSQFIGGSPDKHSRDDIFTNEFDTYSPAFKLGSGTPGLSNSFDDSLLYDFTAPMTPFGSSPIKPMMSAKHSMPRSITSAGVLSDVTKRANGLSKVNSKTPSKIPGNVTLKPPMSVNVGFAGSPLKKSVTAKGKHVEFYNDENVNSLFDFGSFPEELSEEGEELDISKGFSKIGSSTSAALSFGSLRGAGERLKPALSRTQSSRF